MQNKERRNIQVDRDSLRDSVLIENKCTYVKSDIFYSANLLNIRLKSNNTISV